MPLAKIDPRLPDIAVAVAAADRVDDALDAVDHLRPIHPGVLDRDPEPAGGAGFMKRVSGANKRLRGIAAGVEAGAAHFPLLDHGDACALAACFGAAVLPAAPAPTTIRSYGAPGRPVIKLLIAGKIFPDLRSFRTSRNRYCRPYRGRRSQSLHRPGDRRLHGPALGHSDLGIGSTFCRAIPARVRQEVEAVKRAAIAG